VVLWLGWTLLFGGVFSYTQGIYHSYYTSALAPGIAALTGMSVVGAAGLVRRNRGWIVAAVALALVTLWVQWTVAGRFTGFFDWVRPLTVIVVLAGLAAIVASLRWRYLVTPGLAVVVAGLLFIPGAWSGHETAHASLNTTLPQAGPRQGAAGRTFGSDAFDNGITQLAAWLRSRDDTGARWDLVTANSQNASTLIARHELSVMALGGFMGRDPTITVHDFAQLVAAGDVRYVLVSGGMGGPGRGVPARTVPGNGRQPQGPAIVVPPQAPAGQSTTAGANSVLAAVRAVCAPVTDDRLPAQFRNGIYDCAGKADTLAPQR
jgi:4-amino-4-deoxy-L-arabinose transferase-like glycosyltransferase